MANSQQARLAYAVFFFATLTFVHLALCARLIRLRAEADIVRRVDFAGGSVFVFFALVPSNRRSI
jgi:hypothetical protein